MFKLTVIHADNADVIMWWWLLVTQNSVTDIVFTLITTSQYTHFHEYTLVYNYPNKNNHGNFYACHSTSYDDQ